MMRSISPIHLLIMLAVTAWLTMGCETKIEDEGAITLAELQGQTVPATPDTTDASDSASSDTPQPPTLSGGDGIGPQGQGGGFLWKPVSESNGKLVVLLPPQYTGHIRGAYIANAKRAAIETGVYTGVHNGGREHFRFSKPGRGYGSGLYAVAVLKAGGSVHWPIPNGSSRTQY
jgi:hypothetical protein